MSNANWDNPGADNWIEAKKAWYVLGSNRVGGMDAPEAVPFANKEAAKEFIKQYGGQVFNYADVPKNLNL